MVNINQFSFFILAHIFLKSFDSCKSSAFLLILMLIMFCAAANVSLLIYFVLITAYNSKLPSAIFFSAISISLQLTNLSRLNCSNSCSASDYSFFSWLATFLALPASLVWPRNFYTFY